MNTKPTKRPVGRPRLDPTGTLQPASVKLSPSEIAWLRQYGGSVNAAIRKLVTTAMQS